MSNISEELVNSLRAYVGQQPALEFLDGAAIARVTEAVADAYVEDRGSIWWWDTLRAPARTEPYGKADGVSRLQDLLRRMSDPFTLVVTDDERPPWVGVRGSLERLADMLRVHQYFEYFIVDDSLSWIVFDTHHNSLVIAGDLDWS